jgi:hypothetical protein
VLLVLEVALRTPVALRLSSYNLWHLSQIYLAAAVPFFTTGVLFAVVFARNAEDIPWLYAADLMGASLACLAVVPLLDWIGGPNTIVFAGVVMALAAASWAASTRGRGGALVLAGLLIGLIVANRGGRLIDVIYARGVLVRAFVTVEYSRWNAFSRVEVDHYRDGTRWVAIDGDARSLLMDFDPRDWSATPLHTELMDEAPSVVNVLRPRGSYAIIGPGGGVDVMRALGNGSPRVEAVDINPIIVNDVMRGRYAGWTHHLYDDPRVHVHVADGRSWIRASSRRFDVVELTLVDTWASTAAGAYALTENNLYTVEAFKEYFRHLTPDGMIAITRWEFQHPREALRVVSIAMQALHELDVADPARNFMVVSEGPLDVDGRPVVVLAKESPFTMDEQARAVAHLAGTRLMPQYLPYAPTDNAFGRLIAGNDPGGFSRDYAFDITPTTDNAPFFFFTLKTGRILSHGLESSAEDWKVNLGVVVLAFVLLLSLAAVLLFLLLPMALHGGAHGRTLQLTYFVALGLGYILVEIALIQRFVLFLGNPTYALTVVIFLLLLSSGIGSYASRVWLTGPSRLSTLLLLVAVLLGAAVLALHHVLAWLVGLPFPFKLLISSGLIVPLGFVMGMPFPTGLRWLGGEDPRDVPPSAAGARGAPDRTNTIEWAWAMNAGSSVLGSVLAMVIAMYFGLDVTLAGGAAAYLVARLLAVKLRPAVAGRA